MAKIVQDMIVIKFSKLVKDSTKDSAKFVTHEMEKALEEVAQELAGEEIVVEIERVE